MSLVAGRRAGIVQVSHRVLERPTHVVFCIWSLLLSSSAVETQHCLLRRSPGVRRRQRNRGPSLSRRRSPGLLLAPLLLSGSAVEYIEAHCCLRRRRPCVHCAKDAQVSIVGSAVKATCCSRTSRRRSVVDYLRYHVTGPASLAEQIGPEHGCSLLLLVPLSQLDTSSPLVHTPPRSRALSLHGHSTWARITACGR